MIKTYRDLIVWQKAMDLVMEVYKITAQFPSSEIYSLSSQMKRSAVSIASNIAEGRRRGSRKELRQFFNIAYGSGAELETQLEIGKRMSFGKMELYVRVESLLTEIMKMLNVMITRLKNNAEHEA